MGLDSRVDQLLSRWEQLRDQGQVVAAAELCRSCPELLDEVERGIRKLNALAHVLAPMGSTAADDRPRGDSASPSAPATPIPGYEVLDVLGRGGMGIVYQARQTALDRVVAVKMILGGPRVSPTDMARFRREAQIMALVQHPNIVQVYDVGELDGRLFLVMEYLDGGSLADFSDGKPLPPTSAAELVRTLAEALEAAHERGVIHRDLKPSNIMLRRKSQEADRISDFEPKVGDFGLAKHLAAGADQTQSGEVMGTPSYMAPEQALGQIRELGPAVDIHALGAILYELLTGRPPFLGATVLDTLNQVCVQEPVPPRQLQPKVPRDLETICLKCLHKDPRRRYSGALALVDDLGRFLRAAPVQARPVGRLERGWRWCRRKPSQAALAAVLGLGLIVLLGVWLWFTQRLETQLQLTESAEGDLRQTLTNRVAENLDTDLRFLDAIPQTVAAVLERRNDWKEEQLEDWLQDILRRNPSIQGMTVAFEPFCMNPARRDYALYVYRQGQTINKRQLVPPYFTPLYREWDWYKEGRQQRELSWGGEPWRDPRKGGIPLVACMVPFRRAGTFTGVVTLELSTTYLNKVHNELDQLRLGPGSYPLLITAEGTCLSHPNQQHEFPSAQANLKRIPTNPGFVALLDRFTKETAGEGEAIDFTTGQPALFRFARIPTTNWTFVVVTPKKGYEAQRNPGKATEQN